MSLPVKASLSFVFCSLIQKGIAIITNPIFARIIPTNQMGEVVNFSNWSTIVCIFTTLNLQYGSFNNAQLKYANDRDRYSSSVQGVVSLLTVGALCLFILCPEVWRRVFDMSDILIVMMLIEQWALFSTGIWMGKKRFDFNYKPMVALTLATSLLIPVVGLILVPRVEEKGFVRIAIMVAVNVVVGVTIFIYNCLRGKTLFVKEYWKYALGFNLPLIPYYLSQTVFNVSDVIIIRKLVNESKSGIYGMVYMYSTFLVFVLNAINEAYTPWYYRKINAKDSSGVMSINRSLMLFVASMLLILMFIGPEVILILLDTPYYEAVWVFPPVVESMFFLFLVRFAINIEFFYEKKLMLVEGTAIAAVMNIVLNFLLIPRLGYAVAGYTTLISYVFFWLANLLNAKKICKQKDIDFKEFLDFKSQLLIGIGSIAAMVGITLSYYNFLVRYILLFIAMIVLFFARKKIIALIKQLMALKKMAN